MTDNKNECSATVNNLFPGLWLYNGNTQFGIEVCSDGKRIYKHVTDFKIIQENDFIFNL